MRGEQPVAGIRAPVADPVEVETVVADTVRLPPKSEAESPAPARKKSWYCRRRVWLAAAVVFLLLAGEDEKEGDTDDFTPPLTTASAENKTSRAAPEDLPDPSATGSANELVKSRVEKPPIAEVAVLPPPPEPVVDEPVDSKRDLAARFETAVVAGDYGTAEALIDEAIGQDAKNTDVEHARQTSENSVGQSRQSDGFRSAAGGARDREAAANGIRARGASPASLKASPVPMRTYCGI